MTQLLGNYLLRY